MNVGIESFNFYSGVAYLDVMKLAEYRNLDAYRFENLMMREKSVALPFEDPVTYGVNAAKPILDRMSAAEKEQIEMVITCSESGIDFGKSMSTYIHHYLGLNRNCRLFEIKQACYSGTAGLQMAINFVLSQTSPGAKALVIATDISRFVAAEAGTSLSSDWSYAEPSSGAGAIAMLVSDNPKIFQVDIGANGYYGYEVMDTCRPEPDMEAGDSDLSLMSYLDCCEQAYLEYEKRVEGVDYKHSFDYLAFHTPFGGMVKGAHRTMMRKLVKLPPPEIEEDFEKRVLPSIGFCQRVGNVMGATLYLALIGLINNGNFDRPKRIGCFSYGSGCCSEFFSGVVFEDSPSIVRGMGIEAHLNGRYELKMDEYITIIENNVNIKFGTRNTTVEHLSLPEAWKVIDGKEKLYLHQINEFHREYKWS
ncbi:Polyketide biosynthesis 3-hydroxy-3-methylglutaryl-ACP synthase PksG [Pseudoalteromonas holothuriae]|uniref:Polyketide biosynthesis 3-hydroxy-3-methylglutaryl-ACP synthase PksG n=1 Tax=Pseudoalteromonas holothuriae TaxID=2963714 RepID=A0A9W4R5E1_9GAMM|nr:MULTISPECIES: hydroxymethylglutaryl-CoA synthase family protein [unclassified Pseudoalteromonas]CAH9066911.1 Polyketide biosynthesis 3-hydroxy-3-methylglutaryl-ACP synthase PksG [Pseudoalteromonas sp. CIP111854]CAH9068059.1 Polyketide biosynthesis 3-hydroxy-3-methylglutaryl-ACP synthase PksG [Pseudoalteromonas sp. CIP111951]